jgi:predicted nucleic acid-binding protein
MIAVVDASVIIKWLIADPTREPDTAAATSLMEAVAMGEVGILQPVHWLIEVAGVLTRLSPDRASEDTLMLQAMEFPTTDDPAVLERAIELALDTGQHLFDTLYHAVALETEGALLITADDRYLGQAARRKRIRSLSEWRI